MHSERTIRLSRTGLASEDEIETKRRLFWVTYTFDRTLSVILGRPFTLEDRNIDVEYPNNMSLPETKRAQIIHWIKLQRLQSSAVSHLYTVRVSGTTTGKSSPDQASVLEWVKDMSQRLALWNEEAASLADVNGQTVDWCETPSPAPFLQIFFTQKAVIIIIIINWPKGLTRSFFLGGGTGTRMPLLFSTALRRTIRPSTPMHL